MGFQGLEPLDQTVTLALEAGHLGLQRGDALCGSADILRRGQELLRALLEGAATHAQAADGFLVHRGDVFHRHHADGAEGVVLGLGEAGPLLDGQAVDRRLLVLEPGIEGALEGLMPFGRPATGADLGSLLGEPVGGNALDLVLGPGRRDDGEGNVVIHREAVLGGKGLRPVLHRAGLEGDVRRAFGKFVHLRISWAQAGKNPRRTIPLGKPAENQAAVPSSMNGRWISNSAKPAEGVPMAEAPLASLTRSPATTASSTEPAVAVA